MASGADQLAANTSWGALAKATDLRKRIFFALGLLIVYRIGTYIPVPGIDGLALREFMTAASGIGGMLNMFTGGAISRMGIFALGIMPYISASIIVQLVGAMYEPWKALKKEGEIGRRKLNQYTRYLTVLLALGQSYGSGRVAGSGRSGDRSGLVLPRRCGDYAGRRHHVPDVAGRTDHRTRHRQRHFAIIFVGIIAEIPAALANFLRRAGRARCRPPSLSV